MDAARAAIHAQRECRRDGRRAHSLIRSPSNSVASSRSRMGATARVARPAFTSSSSASKTSSAKNRYSASGSCSRSSISAVVTLASPITAGQPFAKATRPDADGGLRPAKTSDASLASIASVVWFSSEHLVVEDPARGDPRWSKPGCDQELNGRGRDESCDQVFGFLRSDDLVVVVDDEPAIGGPGSEILGKDLRENVNLRGRA